MALNVPIATGSPKVSSMMPVSMLSVQLEKVGAVESAVKELAIVAETAANALGEAALSWTPLAAAITMPERVNAPDLILPKFR